MEGGEDMILESIECRNGTETHYEDHAVCLGIPAQVVDLDSGHPGLVYADVARPAVRSTRDFLRVRASHWGTGW
jgi:hypothetical protein